MRTLNLTATESTWLDSYGNGVLQAGPIHPGEIWYPSRVSVSAYLDGSVITGVATCQIYAGEQIAPWTFVDQTYNVLASGSSMIRGRKLHPGKWVFAVFSNAGLSVYGNTYGPVYPGTYATLVITGKRTVS